MFNFSVSHLLRKLGPHVVREKAHEDAQVDVDWCLVKKLHLLGSVRTVKECSLKLAHTRFDLDFEDELLANQGLV